MRKALLVVAAMALLIWVASWFRAEDAVATSAGQPWPGGLGPLESASDRYPPLHANDASRKLTALARALPKSDAADAFVQREIARGDLAIGGSPGLPDTSPIRDLLLREPVIWEHRKVGVGDPETGARRVVQMTVARALVASALTKARASDPAAWEELRAVWNLARSLDRHPEMMSQTAALTMARMINAVAWKMPLPAPTWFADLQRRDSVRPLLEAYHYQTASYWESGSGVFPTKWLAMSIDEDRRIAEKLVTLTQCDVNMPMNELGTDLRSVWRRAFRYRAEREATANALRVREGKPIEMKSVCSDGAWSLDGTTLRFSREIQPGTTENAMALVLRIEQ